MKVKKDLNSIKINKTNNLEEKIKLGEKSINNLFHIDFSLFYFPSIRLNFFNNYFKDEKTYNNFMGDFYHKILKFSKNKTYSELERSSSHTHNIKDNKRVEIINKILDDYVKRYPFLPNINIQMRQEFYQIDCLAQKRIIGIRYENTFYILFFDPHHLIFKDDKFNTDTTSYKDGSTFYIDSDIKIFYFEHLLENEKCLNCEVMDKLLSNKVEE